MHSWTLLHKQIKTIFPINVLVNVSSLTMMSSLQHLTIFKRSKKKKISGDASIRCIYWLGRIDSPHDLAVTLRPLNLVQSSSRALSRYCADEHCQHGTPGRKDGAVIYWAEASTMGFPGEKVTGVQICFHISYGPLSSISAPQTFGNCCMCAKESLRAVVKLRVESVKHASANLNKNLNLLRSLELWPEQTREYAKRLPCVQLRTKAHSHSLPFDRYRWQ